jgi:DNA-binding beta-propeller fold protein YncE
MKTLALLAVLVLPLARAAAEDGAYRLARTFPIGGVGGWDYLTFDAASRRLFIARATRVQVVDVDKGTLVGEITGTNGVHGVALAADLGEGFASDGKANAVTVFDLKTLKVLATIEIPGRNPDAIIYEPATKRVLTFNGASRDATVIDAVKRAVVATTPLPGKPEFAAVDGRGGVFVNIEDTSQLIRIDAAKASAGASIALSPCEEPTGLSIDAANRRLFAGCHNKLMVVVDPDEGKVVAALPIGAGVDATAFDAGAHAAFSSNGDGTLTVIREDGPDAFSVAQNAGTQKGARTMAVDFVTHDVYLVTADLKPGAAKSDRPKPVDGTFRVLVFSLAALK